MKADREELRLPGMRAGIPVLFRDDALLVIDKPAGLLTSPDRYDPDRPNLMRLLHDAIARAAGWAKDLGLSYVMNVHRLDLGTSGVLVLARSHEMLSKLAEQFRTRTVEKEYVALVQGAPAEDAFRIDLAIGLHPNRPGIAVIAPNRGKPAATRVEVVERYRQHALVRALPETGRTHQIRVHLKSAGCPIVGDADYGGRPLFLSGIKAKYQHGAEEERPLMGRTALHAARITLDHPVSGERMSVEAPWPKDLEVSLKYLRKFGA